MCAGAVASGQIRVVSGMPVSDPWRTWLAPFPLAIGLLALATCAYLAAVYLTLETTGDLQEDFRRRALGAGAVFAVLAALALILARSGAPWIWHGLTSRAAVIAVPLAIALALLSGWAVFARRYWLARVAAAAEVALLLAGWALAQYPYLVVPDLTFENAAASPAMMRAALIVFGIGALFLIPSLWFLYRVFKADLPGAVGVVRADFNRFLIDSPFLPLTSTISRHPARPRVQVTTAGVRLSPYRYSVTCSRPQNSGTPRPRSCCDGSRVGFEVKNVIYAGVMFWFTRNRLCGSYFPLIAASRAYVAAP